MRTRIIRGLEDDYFIKHTIPGFYSDIRTSTYPPADYSPTLPDNLRNNIIRTVLKEAALSDWYRLYLLSWMVDPVPSDIQYIHKIWDLEANLKEENISKRIIIIDLLYRWKNTAELLRFLNKCDNKAIKDEILWALAILEAPEATSYVENEIRDIWNKYFSDKNLYITDFEWQHAKYIKININFDEPRKLSAFWRYLYEPVGEPLLKRLCSDSNLHPSLRFFLLSNSPWEGSWKKPFIQKVCNEIFLTNPSKDLYGKATHLLGLAYETNALLNLWSDDIDAWRQRDIIGGLLWARDEKALPIIEKTIEEIWIKRFVNTKGSDEAFMIDKLSSFSFKLELYSEENEDILSLLENLIKNQSIEPNYRAFLVLISPPKLKTELLSTIKQLLNQVTLDTYKQVINKQLSYIERNKEPLKE